MKAMDVHGTEEQDRTAPPPSGIPPSAGVAEVAESGDSPGAGVVYPGDEARCRRVEDAMYRRARGYKVAVRKTYKVKRVEYDPDTGKKTLEREELQTGLDEVVVPADVRAGAYWLVNRSPSRWREHPRPKDGDEVDVGGEVDFPPLDPPDEPPMEEAEGLPEEPPDGSWGDTL